MKTFSLMTVLLLMFGQNAKAADHSFYRHIDEHVVDAIRDARAIRWTLREKFDQSREFRSLLRDADQVLDALRRVEDSVLGEDRIREIHERVDVAHERLMELDRNLGLCDFATHVHEDVSHFPGGYSYRPASQHGGVVHVTTLRTMIASLDAELDTLHDEVEPGYRRRPVVRPPVNYHPTHGHVHSYPVPFGKSAGVMIQIKKK